MKKRIGMFLVSFVIALSISASIFVSPLTISPISATPNISAFEAKIYDDFYAGFPDTYGNITIGGVKELRDFADNIYYAVEFEPMGYTIYDEQFEIPLERNAKARSPYYDLSGDLIYGGATYYYEKPTTQPADAELYRHTVLDTELIADEETQIALVASSTEMNANITAEVATTGKVNTGAQPNGTWEEYKEIPNKGYIADTYACDFDPVTGYVTTSYNHINPLDPLNPDPSDPKQGRCGYVAAAFLAYYARMQWGWTQFAPNGWGEYLVDAIQGGNVGESNGTIIKNALDAYSRSVGRTNIAYVNNSPSSWSVYDRINEGKPVILGGTLPYVKKAGYFVQHAVTVYASQRTVTSHLFGIKTYKDYYYWVNYGWAPSNSHMMPNGVIYISGSYNDIIVSQDVISNHALVNF